MDNEIPVYKIKKKSRINWNKSEMCFFAKLLPSMVFFFHF